MVVPVFPAVGTTEETDRQLPANIISIHRTYDQKQLAEIYSAADLFINPTRQDNFPTVNIEALACGLPVLAFATGGCPEIISESCGSIVAKNDFEALKNEVIRICSDHPYTKKACLRRAQEYDMSEKFKEYVELITDILDKR